ncbi:type VI secretion system baseplate subunit TssE [Bosea caraganae]|uniref:Type VI secretion system baseplate subunit TssE n=1 Tax=Bosea caraganae TaxID=2763117 RepID=A0A370L847_9HYPH|nr:type VI secretion system baseplate subunit TssE [Bosea caraganae]RDJ25096.1 type VI secretion system baseplate subunit TssE [Bosea caraganae]RDJ26206.1 type VI secretion system baseplate subunit TssE [Bosea caraganae]
MFSKSLFERLETAVEGQAAQPGAVDRWELADSVFASVRRILNARQGCCEIRIDFGMPDLNDISKEASETVPAIARAVRYQLETFEPRLSQVQVRVLPESDRPGDFAFGVSAVLKVGDEGEAMKFDTVLGSDRQMRLRT